MLFQENSRRWAIYLSLLAVVVVGGGLRGYGISDKSLWMDELYSLSFSGPDNSLATVFHKTVEDVHPPFYQILLWLVFKVFGYGELTGRIFSAVMGVLVIPVIFLLGKKLFDAWVGVYAALLASVNFYLVMLSQDSRSYQLLVFLVVSSFLAFLCLIERKDLKSTIVYAVLGAMLVNTHYFGFFPIMTQAVLLLYFSFRTGFDKKLFKVGCVAGVIIVVSLVPIVIYVIANFKRTLTWIPKPSYEFVIDDFMVKIGHGPVALISLLLLLIGVGDLLRRKDSRDVLKLLLLWWMLGFAIAYIRSLFYTPILSYRNMIVFLPVVILFVAYGCSLVEDRFARSVLLCFLFLMSLAYLYSEPDLRDLRISHDIRSPVNKVMADNRGLPVYSPYPELITAYLKVMGLPVQVESLESIEAKMERGQSPACFNVVDMWNKAMEKNYPSSFNVEVISRDEYPGTAFITYKVKGTFHCEGKSTGD